MLIECENLRIDRDRRPLVSDLTFRVEGTRIAWLGDFKALFELLSGRAELGGGSFALAGAPALARVKRGELGLVLADSAYQPRWTALGLATKSGLLCGLPKALAHARALQVFQELGLRALCARPLGSLARAEFRAVQLARALMTDPRLLALETPFSALGSAEIDWLWARLALASEKRQLIVSFDDAVLDFRELLGSFEQVVCLRQGQLVGLGSLASLQESVGAYLVSVTRGAERLARVLRADGCRVAPEHADDAGPVQLLVQSDAGDLADRIARAATAEQVPVIELLVLPAEESGGAV